MKEIVIHHASHGNLKNISVSIPRNKLVVLTGVSGSGKSTLGIDVLYQECQRQYLEAMSFQGINKPAVEHIENVSPAIVISQDEKNNNPRSSLGTITNIYTDLRMIYEKIGNRKCPECHQEINQGDCKEEIEKSEDDFIVYLYCNHCGKRIKKLTCSHFSFNTQAGACHTCKGLGHILKINQDELIDDELSLKAGAIRVWQHRYLDYQLELIKKVILNIDLSVQFKAYDQKTKDIILNGNDKYEGVLNNLKRRYKEKEGQSKTLQQYFKSIECPTCHGEKLNSDSLAVLVNHQRISDLSKMSLIELDNWLNEIRVENEDVKQYIYDLKTKIKRIIKVGLGYLHLDRTYKTLSGGEKQRIRLAAALDSTIVGIIYILDEPTVGLHPQDTNGVIEILKDLRDKGNSVIVIEHDEDVIKASDYLIDLGPKAGKLGGEIVATGSYQDILNNDNSLTGRYFKEEHVVKKEYRDSKLFLTVNNVNINNLKDVKAKFKINCLNVVTGVSGAGKSSLVFDGLVNNFELNQDIINADYFEHLVLVRQASIITMKRSIIATYVGLYDEIRKIFGKLDKQYSAKYFSFNTKGGRCENCEGLGTITSNMLFFKDVEITCPVCQGKRFKDEVLKVKYQGYTINQILHLSVLESLEVFKDNQKIMKILELLKDIGLGYLQLGQSLTTLSGGEKQRLKLTVELLNNQGKHILYLIDEPTVGLHPLDVENLMKLFEQMISEGHTIILIEHNLQVIKQADWIIDLGPGGGIDGGKVIATGTPKQLKMNYRSVTGKYL